MRYWTPWNAFYSIKYKGWWWRWWCCCCSKRYMLFIFVSFFWHSVRARLHTCTLLTTNQYLSDDETMLYLFTANACDDDALWRPNDSILRSHRAHVIFKEHALASRVNECIASTEWQIICDVFALFYNGQIPMAICFSAEKKTGSRKIERTSHLAHHFQSKTAPINLLFLCSVK